jgi:serine/threonine protein kinase
MHPDPIPDEALVQRLPLPLAQLCRRAHNAKTALERHLTAFYLWEAGLKLLACVAVVEYAGRGPAEPRLAESLQNLARPSLGHWWEFVRSLVPALADRGDQPFDRLRDLLLGKQRSDCPRAAGLEALLREELEGQRGARAAVRLGQLFDYLVRFRNAELGHGAAGQRPAEFYTRMGPALLAGVSEVLERLDPLAGRRLVHVPDVRRLGSGNWLVERYELCGESARRLESLEVPEAEASALPRPGRLYLLDAAGGACKTLHPLVVYDPEAGRVFFLNARRGSLQADYLCYTTGEVVRRAELGGEQRELLARVLGGPVDDDAVRDWAERSRAGEPPPAAEPQPRRTVGEYELVSRIGRGGMGVVYRAWQPSLGRQVALKCLIRTGDPKAEARFAREIHALGRVEHPHLMKVFTSGADGDQWFYTMELIEGTDLAGVCSQLAAGTASTVGADVGAAAVNTACERQRRAVQPLSGEGPPAEASPPRPAAAQSSAPRGGQGYVARVVELVRQAAEAAHALHEAGIVHRDVKPGNIMLAAGGGHAVLMDLGLAQLADEAEGKLTRTRQFVGTLRYASPEQVLAADRLDRRSDVYSLGATLWELLALRPLFDADEGTPTPTLMERIQHDEPGRLRRHNLNVPADLEAVVLKCLQKKRTLRYGTAAQLAEDLGRWLRGEPVLAQPLTARYLLGKYLHRYRLRIASAAAVLAAVLVATLAALWQINAARLAAEEKSQETDRERLKTQAALEAKQAALGQAEAMQIAERKGRARAYVNQAELLLQRQNVPGALAYLVEAVVLDPGSSRPQARLLDLLEQRNWVRADGPIAGAAFDAEGGAFWTMTRAGRLALWDRSAGVALADPVDLGSGVRLVEFSPDRKAVAHTAADFKVVLREVPTGRTLATLEHTAPVNAIAFSPDGKRLVTAAGDWRDELGYAQVWDAVTGAAVGRRLVHWGRVAHAAFSPDGKRVATASWDWTARLWDAATGAPAGDLLQHRGWVGHVRFSPDGRWLLTCSWDRTVRLWDVSGAAAVPAGRLEHPGPVAGADFLPPRNANDRAPRVVACGFRAADKSGFVVVWRKDNERFAREQEFTHPEPVDRVRALADSVVLAQSVNSALYLDLPEDDKSRAPRPEDWAVAAPLLVSQAFRHQAGITGFAIAGLPKGGPPPNTATAIEVLTCGEDEMGRVWRGRERLTFQPTREEAPKAALPAKTDQGPAQVDAVVRRLTGAELPVPAGPEPAALEVLARVVGQLTGQVVGEDGKLRAAPPEPEAASPPEVRVASASWDEAGNPTDRLTRVLSAHLERSGAGLWAYAWAECSAGRSERALRAARRGCGAARQRLRIAPQVAWAWAQLADSLGLQGIAELEVGPKGEGRGHLRETLEVLAVLEEKCGDAVGRKSTKAHLAENRSIFHLYLEEYAEALRAARRAVELRDESEGGHALRCLALAHLMLGQYGEAERIYLANAGRPLGDHLFAWWVLEDFAWLRRAGLGVPGMDRIEPPMREALARTPSRGKP